MQTMTLCNGFQLKVCRKTYIVDIFKNGIDYKSWECNTLFEMKHKYTRTKAQFSSVRWHWHNAIVSCVLWSELIFMFECILSLYLYATLYPFLFFLFRSLLFVGLQTYLFEAVAFRLAFFHSCVLSVCVCVRPVWIHGSLYSRCVHTMQRK